MLACVLGVVLVLVLVKRLPPGLDECCEGRGREHDKEVGHFCFATRNDGKKRGSLKSIAGQVPRHPNDTLTTS